MTIDQKLDEALNYLATSRKELDEGKVVVMEGFQNEVRELCLEIGNLPVVEMQNYATKLSQLSEELKVFEGELRTHQTQVQQDIFSLNRKQKALKTYETVSHSHKEDDA